MVRGSRVTPTWRDRWTTCETASHDAEPGCGSTDVLDGLQQREMQNITLGVTATDAMRQRRKARQQANRGYVIAAGECDQSAARWQPDASRCLTITRSLGLALHQLALQALGKIPVARADKGDHRVQVVEGAEAVSDVPDPGAGEFVPTQPAIAAS